METSTAIVLALVLLIGLWVPYLHLVHPSRKGARTHLVHMVEAAGSPRYWPGHWWVPTDSTGGGRCAGGSLLNWGDATRDDEAGISQQPGQADRALAAKSRCPPAGLKPSVSTHSFESSAGWTFGNRKVSMPRARS